jgi:hypothetical protein
LPSRFGITQCQLMEQKDHVSLLRCIAISRWGKACPLLVQLSTLD